MLDHDVFYNRQRSGFEEINSYMPKYILVFLEMKANNKFAGYTLDLVAGEMENFVKNWFFDSMDEKTLTDYENFLGLTGFGVLNIQDRRNLVKASWIGGQKMSRPRIKALVKAYLASDCEVHFTHILKISPVIKNPDATLYLGELQDILYNQIPAHIEWILSTIIAYGGDANVTSSVRHWAYPFELCGTNPDIATLGAAIEDEIIVDEDAKTYGYPFLSESDTKAGTNPDISTLGAVLTDDVEVESTDSSNTYDVPPAHEDN